MRRPISRAAIALIALLPALAGTPAPAQSDALQAQVQALLAEVRGRRVGLLTNPTGIDGQLAQIADVLASDPSVELVAFFAPEHGLRGDQQAGGSVVDYTDPHTGLPVYSVYGSRLAPTDEQLALLDVLVFDIQDVGVRYYTFIWTMTHAMEACARNGKAFVVFDRPNPVGCDRVEGAPNTVDYGLVGRLWPGEPFGLATRHGMTPGEVARLVNGEWMDPPVDLTVIPIPGYHRETRWEELGRPWVLPSPNMPTVDTAFAYIATCVFEGTNVSEGRGTTRPFELIGAPFIDGFQWAADLNALDLPGVRFRAAAFIPTFSKYAGEVCSGVQLHILDRQAYDPERTGLWMLKTLKTRWGDQFTIRSRADLYFGVIGLADAIETQTPEEIIAGWQQDLAAFRALREAYLIYGGANSQGLLGR